MDLDLLPPHLRCEMVRIGGRYFPSQLAAKLTGVSRVTLHNWAIRRFLVPSGPAPADRHRRRYTFRDLVTIQITAAARDRGVDVRHLRRLVQYLRTRPGLDLHGEPVDPRTFLVFDGHVQELCGEPHDLTSKLL